jgi:two-component system, LuxR family, sensor kinase FixL
MNYNQTSRFWRAVAQCLCGSIALALLTFVCFRLHLTLATTVCLYLIIIVLVSLGGSFLSSAVVSLIAIGCLAYYFLPPIFSFQVSDPFDVVAMIVFLTTSAVITHSVTRVRKSAERLREQANLLNLTHDAIFVRDMNAAITYWNRGAEELYGWTREEAVGKVSHQLMQTIFPAPLEKINAELLRTGRWEGELVLTKRDGTKVIVASRWSMQRDERGRPLATLVTNNDITERKRSEEASLRAEDALRKAQAELAHVTRVATLGELTASIAHEVNQPLGALVNNAGACLGWLDAENLEEARNSVALVMDDAQRASEIITRIRALVKKAPPQKDWLEINQTIREAIALAQSEMQRNHIALETQLSDDMPLVFADRIQLQQVMLNLMMNAIEAMTQTTSPRELLISSGADNSTGVVVVVRDSGPGLGLDSKSVERLFEPFYTTKPQGMGMGLAICRSIVQAHGGRLWAATNRDCGASFHFSLPTGEELE